MRRLWWSALCLLLLACSDAPDPPTAPEPPPIQFTRASADEIAHGERVSRVLGCNGCHGDDLTGEDWSDPALGRLWTANLTRAVPAYSDEALAGVIRTGRRPDGHDLWEMPSHLFTQLAPGDMTALIAYLRSRPPTGAVRPPPSFEEGARRWVAAGILKPSPARVQEEGGRWPPEAGRQHALARYIVRATCAECHGMNLEGGPPHPQATPRPDLRMVAAYERDQFHRLLRTGAAAGDRQLGLMSEVARARYRHLTDAEVEAIFRYLQAIGNAH